MDEVAQALAAYDRGEVPERAALKAAVKATLAAFAAAVPGRSVEVRVPPYAVVQAVAGGTHRRGTPPATVECDARTWLELVTGRTGWTDAIADGRVRASGERSDLSPYLPQSPGQEADRPGTARAGTARQQVTYGEHTDQVVDVWQGEPDRPLVVVVHGGFWRPAWDRTHAAPQAAALAAAGYPVALPEYRRVPGEPDTTCADLRAALAAVPELVHHDGVVLVGHSAGGQLVLWAAATCPPPGLVRTVGLAPVADLVLAEDLALGDGAVRAFLGQGARDRPDLDPAVLPAPAGQVTLVTAARDVTVPAVLAHAYADRHGQASVVAVPDADHMDLVDPAHPAWPVVLAAVAG